MSVPGTPERDAVRHAPDLPGVLPEGLTTEDERWATGNVGTGGPLDHWQHPDGVLLFFAPSAASY